MHGRGGACGQRRGTVLAGQRGAGVLRPTQCSYSTAPARLASAAAAQTGRSGRRTAAAERRGAAAAGAKARLPLAGRQTGTKGALEAMISMAGAGTSAKTWVK